jgi:radical SAM superfamily enzyme YgiQ (UPF0313 family)
MRILLLAPDFDPEYRTERNSRFANVHKGAVAPLGLATVAAITPADVEVTIWDEAVHPAITEATEFDGKYDLVGVTGYETHIRRVRELGEILRRRGFFTVVGGPGVSAAPEQYRDSFDVLFIGEAEYTWPQFIADWKAGTHRPEYRQVARVDMLHSPIPRWELIAGDLGRYRTAAVQTTRGCPFDCEFCNVTYLFGRTARHKTVAQVVAEVRLLHRLGAKKISFCDDNFIGNPGYARELLKALVALNETFPHPMSFFTSVTLNVAKEPDILELLADANFTGVFIGIESPNFDSLVETNKPQNYRTDMVADVRKVQSYGLAVEAGMIVGFDHDDTTIFGRHAAFLRETCIVKPYLNMLSAPVGTRLWTRLHREGRVLDLSSGHPSSRDAVLASVRTNVVPQCMTRAELLAGYRDLLKEVRSWPAFEARVKGMVDGVTGRREVLARLAARRRPRSLAKKLGEILSLFRSTDWRGRAAALRILLHTRRRAPFLLNRVTGLVRRQAMDASNLPRLLESIEKEIRREAAGEAEWQVEERVAMVPEALRKPYKEEFAGLHDRVYAALVDKSRTHEVLVQVTCEWVSRCDPAAPPEGHATALLAISERVVAEENGAGPGAAARGQAPSTAPELAGLNPAQAAMKLRRLSDDVMREAEKDLRRSHLVQLR